MGAVIVGRRRGREKLSKSIGDMLLEEVKVLKVLLVVTIHGSDLVSADADSAEERALKLSCRHCGRQGGGGWFISFAGSRKRNGEREKVM